MNEDEEADLIIERLKKTKKEKMQEDFEKTLSALIEHLAEKAEKALSLHKSLQK